MPTPLADFYAGKTMDNRGRMLADIQTWSVDRLEHVHDYIQWMFPLREPSSVHPRTPVLTDEEIAEFRSRPELQSRLRTSLDTMLRFYGFAWDGAAIVRSAEWAERSRNWLTPGNHNHLRLTRIMTSLLILGLEDEARALQTRLLTEYDSAHGAITAVTKRYWEAIG